jgi:hypothetical protein
MKILPVILLLLTSSPVFGASVDFWLIDSNGNKERRIHLTEEVGGLKIRGSHIYRADRDSIDINKSTLSFNYDICDDPFCFWLFSENEKDEVNDIETSNFGAGPKYYLIKNDKHKLSFSTGVLCGEDCSYSHRIKYSGWFDFIGFYQPEIEGDEDRTYYRLEKSWKSLKAYCTEEDRTNIPGLIDTECGLMFTMKIGRKDGVN